MIFVVEQEVNRLKKERAALIDMYAYRVAANNDAYRDLISKENTLILIGCLSHTLDKTGKMFDAPELNIFMIMLDI